jgi:hypothetical protein
MARVKKKHAAKHEDFVDCLKNIESIVTREHYERLKESAIARVRDIACGRAAYAWSGGKDSIALRVIANAAGVDLCCLGRSDLEYPAFIDWVAKNKPPGIHILNCGWDMEWLVKHPQMLFPHGHLLAGKWFDGIQRWAQRAFTATAKLNTVLIGNRILDGNFVGKKSDYYLRDGVIRLSPLAHWTHEDIFACIHYEGLANNLPPFYSWPRGYRCGTHSWARRATVTTIQDNWGEIFTIDPSIVVSAAERIDSAKRFMDSRR